MSAVSDELAALVAGPTRRPSEIDWAQAEERIGARLPSDYKWIVDSYGPGSFDGFLWVPQPFSANQYLDLFQQCDVRLDALRTLTRSGEAVPYDLTPGREQLIPWAFTDNGDVCFWVTSGSADPDEWRVAVNEGREPLWMTFDGSASEFLVAVLSGALSVEIFPDDFPYESHAFSTSTI
jgi:hypothetical protein